MAAADNLLRDVAMPIDRAAAGGTEDGYTARCRRVAEALRQGAWSACPNTGCCGLVIAPRRVCPDCD